MKHKIEIGSLLQPEDRATAIQVLSSGKGIIAAFFLTLFGLFADANQEDSVKMLWRAKNKPEGTPLATLMPPKFLMRFIDFEYVAPEFLPILEVPSVLNRYYRIPHFLQLPIKKNVDIPDFLITRSVDNTPPTIINMWFPSYSPVNQFLEDMYETGVIVATTSLNYRHKDSVTDFNEALSFCETSSEKILLLTDDYANQKILPIWSGSYSILSALTGDKTTTQSRLLREGNISAATLSHLYKFPITNPRHIINGRSLNITEKEVEDIVNSQSNYGLFKKFETT